MGSSVCLTSIRGVPQTNCSSYISHLLRAKTHSIFSQSSFVRSYTQSFIWSFMRLILSPWFESKFEFACRHSRHQLWISQSINDFFLVHWRTWLTAFYLKHIFVIDPLNDTKNKILFERKGININWSFAPDLVQTWQSCSCTVQWRWKMFQQKGDEGVFPVPK